MSYALMIRVFMNAVVAKVHKFFKQLNAEEHYLFKGSLNFIPGTEG